jgi:hypothetical protein
MSGHPPEAIHTLELPRRLEELSFLNSVNTEARSVPTVSFGEFSDAYRPWAEVNERKWKES